MDTVAKKCSSKTIVLTGYGGYDKLKIEFQPVPKPSASNVIVNVIASGVNFAELMCRQGTYDRTPKVPAVLGMEAAGVVVDVGDGVDMPKVGDYLSLK
jgi:NADPH:quinone reductase-like Zn-dependent oxidoreductase